MSFLNGKRDNDLSPKLRRGLDRASKSAIILLQETKSHQSDPFTVRRYVFERLNTGGIALNEMEIRNCIYRGPLNNLIKVLARDQAFIDCVDQSNISKRMYDRNLVLRCLAFYERTYHKAKTGLKDFHKGFL